MKYTMSKKELAKLTLIQGAIDGAYRYHRRRKKIGPAAGRMLTARAKSEEGFSIKSCITLGSLDF
jgi:hypothetical protein